MRYRLGVDIGGTFTDIVLLAEDGTVQTKKVLSTPDDYSRAIENSVSRLLDEAGIATGDIAEFAHGTTVATNTIIERRGVKVALITTRGFRDVLELGRLRTPRLYDIRFRKPEPLVPRHLRFEIDERTNAKGEILRLVDTKDLDKLADQFAKDGVATVAICFIHSYVNPENELKAKRWLERRLPGVPISASAQLLPQIQEYERTSTTVVNAYIRPVVERYLSALEDRMKQIGVKVPLTVMQSNGGVLPASLAGANPVYIIESGPAAGVVGAQRMGTQLGLGDLMVFDMGGRQRKRLLSKTAGFTSMRRPKSAAASSPATAC